MKKIISTLFACALMAVGCGPEEAPAPVPAPAACQKPRGVYVTTSLVSSTDGTAAACQRFAPGQQALTELAFNEHGAAAHYDSEISATTNTEVCNTSYADGDCTVQVDCVAAEGDAGARRVMTLKLNPEGTKFSGVFELRGWGTMCPSVNGVITGALHR